MATTADLSKLVSYAVLDEAGPSLSKLVSYAVLDEAGPSLSKLVSFAVLEAPPSAQHDWPNPRGYQRSIALLTHTSNLSETTLAPPALPWRRYLPPIDDVPGVYASEPFPDWQPRPAFAIAPAPTPPPAPLTFWRFRPTVDDEYPDWLPLKKPSISPAVVTSAQLSRRRRPWTFQEYDQDPQLWFPRPAGTPSSAFPVHFNLSKTIDTTPLSAHLKVIVKFRLDQ